MTSQQDQIMTAQGSLPERQEYSKSEAKPPCRFGDRATAACPKPAEDAATEADTTAVTEEAMAVETPVAEEAMTAETPAM